MLVWELVWEWMLDGDEEELKLLEELEVLELVWGENEEDELLDLVLLVMVYRICAGDGAYGG